MGSEVGDGRTVGARHGTGVGCDEGMVDGSYGFCFVGRGWEFFFLVIRSW